MLEPMSAAAIDPRSTQQASARGSASRSPVDLEHGLPVCPFLRSHDARWSSAVPSRDLRCWAVNPAVEPSVSKQRQLCVTAGHASCATYAAAVLADPAPEPDPDGPNLWPDAPSVPVALEGVHARPARGLGLSRLGGQTVLVGVMLVALLVLVVARANPLAGPGPGASPAASAGIASADASPSAAPTGVPSPTAIVTPPPTAAPSPSAAPTRTPAPAASPLTYTVRSGDTVSGIAAKFHTTVKAIVAANNIADPRTIHPGQVLVIP